jgi:hypothetical protein
MALKTLCLIGAAVCFLIKAFSVNTGRLDCMNLGFFFLVLSLLV